MSKHSPLPFWIDDDHFIASGKNDEYLTVADPHASNDIDPCEIEANAEFIVRACNNHYNLIEACDLVVEILTEEGEDVWAYEIGQLKTAIEKAEVNNE